MNSRDVGVAGLALEQPGGLAEHDAPGRRGSGPARAPCAGDADVGVDRGARRAGAALGPLRRDEERVVGLVPRAPPAQLDAVALGLVEQRGDEPLVGARGPQAWAAASGPRCRRARSRWAGCASCSGVPLRTTTTWKRSRPAAFWAAASAASWPRTPAKPAHGGIAAHAAAVGLGEVERGAVRGGDARPVDARAGSRSGGARSSRRASARTRAAPRRPAGRSSGSAR